MFVVKMLKLMSALMFIVGESNFAGIYRFKVWGMRTLWVVYTILHLETSVRKSFFKINPVDPAGDCGYLVCT